MPTDPALPLSGGFANPPVADESITRLADTYEETLGGLEILKERLRETGEEIARRMLVHASAVDAEESLSLGDGRVLTVSRGARYAWDKDILEGLAGPHPSDTMLSPQAESAIERQIAVKRREFDRLEPEYQSELLPALTRKPGALKITITQE